MALKMYPYEDVRSETISVGRNLDCKPAVTKEKAIVKACSIIMDVYANNPNYNGNGKLRYSNFKFTDCSVKKFAFDFVITLCFWVTIDQGGIE